MTTRTSDSMTGVKNSTGCLTLLSQLLLGVDGCGQPSSDAAPPDWSSDIARTVALYGRQDFGELWSLAFSHHVDSSFPCESITAWRVGKARKIT